MTTQEMIEKMLKKSESIINAGGETRIKSKTDKNKKSFECKYWNYFSGICELDGKDCDGDNIDCHDYVDEVE